MVLASGKFVTIDGERTFQHGVCALNVGDTVRVLAYGYGASKQDCGRTGTVVRLTKHRVVVDLGIDGTKSISGMCLARIDA